MTFDDQMRNRKSLCLRQLYRLRMLAAAQDGMPLSRPLAGSVEATTNAVMAVAEAMSRDALGDSERGSGAETFLRVRVTRLAMAAEQAVDAARCGDTAGVLAHLRHFETLTSAIWTVQSAVSGREPLPGVPLPE